MEKTIYCNGNILTMLGDEPQTAEAVVTENDRIIFAGELTEAKQLAKNAQEHDLKGKTMLPAFIDSHSHITAFAGTLGLVSLGEAADFNDIAERIRKAAQGASPNEWIIGFGYDNNTLKEGSHPQKELLDAAAPQNPVMLVHTSGHMGVMNSAALKTVGIDSYTQDISGGKIGRNSHGEPNGYLEEKAFIAASSKAPADSPRLICENFIKAQEIYLKYGVALAQEGLVRQGEMQLLKFFSSNKLLKMPVVGYADLADAKELYQELLSLAAVDGNIKAGGYKIFLDGSPQGKTAWLSKPYEGEQSYCGYPILTDERVCELVKAACREGVQLLAHCNGDAAAEQLIAAFKKACGGNKADNRPVMIHAQTVRHDQLERMKRLGIMPSFFAAHLYYWGDVHLKNLGERALAISPLATAQALKMPFTLHQDTPVLPPDMLKSVWCAVNRISRGGHSMGERQRITPYAALLGITRYAAYQYFAERERGCIVAGGIADLVILDESPLKTKPADIDKISVTETIVNGRTAFKA